MDSRGVPSQRSSNDASAASLRILTQINAATAAATQEPTATNTTMLVLLSLAPGVLISKAAVSRGLELSTTLPGARLFALPVERDDE